MWTRAQIKARGKAATSRNYWKSVFVAFIFVIVFGTTSAIGPAAATSTVADIMNPDSSESEVTAYDEGYTEDLDSYSYGDSTYGYGDGLSGSDALEPDPQDDGIFLAVITSLVVILIVVIAIVIAIDVFIAKPIEVGCRRFFVLNLSHPARVQEVLWAFDNNYLNIVKTLFFRDLKILGWTLLLVVPGIIKSYEYRMVPYLLGQDPSLDQKEAFAQSRQLMTGNKWKTFVLDLSFIGWDLLSNITFGLVGTFYVEPYKSNTEAALFEALAYGNNPTPSLPSSEAPTDAPAETPDGMPVDPRL